MTFAVLAVLHGRIRWGERVFTPDAVIFQIQQGLILYWYLRPLPPQRYYLYRALGGLGYGAAWALALAITLEEEMFAAAEELRFEYAAKLRDEIKDLRRELVAAAGAPASA